MTVALGWSVACALQLPCTGDAENTTYLGLDGGCDRSLATPHSCSVRWSNSSATTDRPASDTLLAQRLVLTLHTRTSVPSPELLIVGMKTLLSLRGVMICPRCAILVPAGSANTGTIVTGLVMGYSHESEREVELLAPPRASKRTGVPPRLAAIETQRTTARANESSRRTMASELVGCVRE